MLVPTNDRPGKLHVIVNKKRILLLKGHPGCLKLSGDALLLLSEAFNLLLQLFNIFGSLLSPGNQGQDAEPRQQSASSFSNN